MLELAESPISHPMSHCTQLPLLSKDLLHSHSPFFTVVLMHLEQRLLLPGTQEAHPGTKQGSQIPSELGFTQRSSSGRHTHTPA